MCSINARVHNARIQKRENGSTYLKEHCGLVVLIEASRKTIWSRCLERRHLVESPKDLLNGEFGEKLLIHLRSDLTFQNLHTCCYLKVLPPNKKIFERR